MANKPQSKKYGEFRIFMQYVGKGMYRVNPAFVPSIAAWLLMHGRVYERAAEGMRQKLAQKTIPGLPEAIRTLEMCQSNLQRLMDGLGTNYARADWTDCCNAIADLMDITPDSRPLDWIPPDQFEHIISEAPSDGTDPSTGVGDIPVRTPSSTREPIEGTGGAADTGLSGAAGVPAVRGGRPVQPPGRRRRRKPGDQGQRAGSVDESGAEHELKTPAPESAQ